MELGRQTSWESCEIRRAAKLIPTSSLVGGLERTSMAT
jgi:hypothetical protein